MEHNLNRSDLISRMTQRQPSVSQAMLTEVQMEECVRVLLDQMVASLASGKRIEIRGFGSFALHHRQPRLGRNPKTGESVFVSAKAVPHFKPGKALRDAVNDSAA